MTFRIALALLAFSAFVPGFASAHDHCEGWLVIDVGGSFYVVIGVSDGHEGMTYLYQESNGIAGLQRGGNSIVTGEPDHCQESEMPDTLIV